MEGIKIKLISYNVGDKDADQNGPQKLFEFAKEKQFDFVFIGLQEIIGDASWTALIKKCFGEHDYVLLKVRNIWAIWLYALVKRSLLPLVDTVESETTASGYAGVLGNKGGVSIRFKYQGISVVVVNGHFTAQDEGYKDRLNDYLDIINGQSFRDTDVKSLLDHDYVFWLGDLNFRINNLSKEEIEDHIREKNFSIIAENDQLNRARAEDLIFKDFKEGELNFPPTFKFDDKSNKYDTSKKQRKPAWTDRILYMIHNDDAALKASVQLLRYYSEREVCGSDHRPVCAEFKLSWQRHPQSLPIVFTDIKTVWTANKDQEVHYRSLINPNNNNSKDKEGSNDGALFKPDKYDWIALVPKNWTLLAEDHITYVYAQCACEKELFKGVSVQFGKKYLSSIARGTQLQLVYFSKRKNCIQGISNVFSFA